MEIIVNLELKKSFIRKQACFEQLTDHEVEKLADLLVEEHCPAGKKIVNEGDTVDSFYLIVSGTADVQHTIVKNNALETISVATLSSGDAIGLNEAGFYSLSGRRTASVVALSDMLLLGITLAEFHGFSLAYSHVNEVMHKNAEAVLGTKA